MILMNDEYVDICKIEQNQTINRNNGSSELTYLLSKVIR